MAFPTLLLSKKVLSPANDCPSSSWVQACSQTFRRDDSRFVQKCAMGGQRPCKERRNGTMLDGEEHARVDKEACRKQPHCTLLDEEERAQQEDEKR